MLPETCNIHVAKTNDFNLIAGKEIFVGVGKRTNALGAKAVAEAFQDHTVSMVEIGKSDLLHLKDGFAMAGREIMAVSPGIDVAVILKVCYFFLFYSDSRTQVFHLFDTFLFDPHLNAIKYLLKYLYQSQTHVFGCVVH